MENSSIPVKDATFITNDNVLNKDPIILTEEQINNEPVDDEELQTTIASDTPVRKRWILFKIDVFVLSFVCLQYWINYVDRIGFTNAYVSGMKEDLNMTGNDFTVANTCFTVGYIVGMLPNNLILLVIPPRIWTSFSTFAWGLLTLGMYKVTSFHQVCVLRFFQALFESSTFSGTHLILGSWYLESELPIRSAVFTSSGLIGSMFSGFMQSSIFTHLHGKRGMDGWRWLFIIDFCITIPISLYGLIFFPGVPSYGTDSGKFSMTHRIFSEKELQYARRRLPARDETLSLDWSVIPRVLKKWHWWVFSFVWMMGGENLGFASTSSFALWLKNQNYTLNHCNNYPSGIFAVGIVATILSAVYLTKLRWARHWHIAIFIAVVMCVVAIMIRVNPLKPSVMFAAQYLGGIAYAGQAVFFAWANVVCQEDLQERAIVLASMNMFSGALNAWWTILFFPATNVPRFEKGCYALIATSIASGIASVLIRVLQNRDLEKKKALPYVNANDLMDEDEVVEDDDEYEEDYAEEGEEIRHIDKHTSEFYTHKNGIFYTETLEQENSSFPKSG